MKTYLGLSYTEANFLNYLNWFLPDELGTDLELIELSYLLNNRDDFGKCSGFILTGGVDVLPAISGGAAVYPNMPEQFLPERDDFEAALYAYAQAYKIPLLGICRGMQYINILEGGKVLDDLGTANEVHKREGQDRIHELFIQENTILHEISGAGGGRVNSAHHQAIDPSCLADSLIVSAISATADRSIEAIEFKDKNSRAFMLGLQWHPERMPDKESSALSQGVKERFLAEVRKS